MTDSSHGSADGIDGRARVAELTVAEGVILYDRSNHRAWVQTDRAVSVGDHL